MKESFKFFKENILKIAIIVGVIFLVTSFSSFTFLKGNEKVTGKVVASFLEGTKDMLNLKNFDLSIALMKNNITACLITLLLGFVPFLYLIVSVLLVNAGLIGAVLSFNVFSTKVPVLKTIIFGLLPHGIFELPALFISMALSIFLCTYITRKILKREDRKFGEVIKNIFLNFVTIVLPLLVVAGLIEGMLTPIIMNTFIK